MYICLCGYPPFNGNTDDAILTKVQHAQLEFDRKYFWLIKKDEEWGDISNDAKDLIRKLLQRDPEKRITAKEAFNHKWFLTCTGSTAPLKKKFMSNLINFSV